MSMSEEKVYVGNKLYRRTVWNIHGNPDWSYAYGFLRFNGVAMRAWLVGGINGHWTATKPEGC